MEGLCPDKRYPNKITSEMQTHCRSEVPEWTENFQELKICGHGTVLALYRCAQNAFSTNVSELLRRKISEAVLLM